MKRGSKLNENCNPSTTKSGPGRFHKEGHKKNSPIASKGAPRDFVMRTADAARKLRRTNIKLAGSFRQFRRERNEARNPSLVAELTA